MIGLLKLSIRRTFRLNYNHGESRMYINLRRGTPEDGEALRDLHEASIRAFGISTYTAAEVESWVGVMGPHRYGEAMTKNGEIFVVAEDADGALAGFCSYKADEVMGLYVAPA